MAVEGAGQWGGFCWGKKNDCPHSIPTAAQSNIIQRIAALATHMQARPHCVNLNLTTRMSRWRTNVTPMPGPANSSLGQLLFSLFLQTTNDSLHKYLGNLTFKRAQWNFCVVLEAGCSISELLLATVALCEWSGERHRGQSFTNNSQPSSVKQLKQMSHVLV